MRGALAGFVVGVLIASFVSLAVPYLLVAGLAGALLARLLPAAAGREVEIWIRFGARGRGR